MRCTTRCATTGARCCGWPTSAPSSITRRWGSADNIYRPTHLVLDLDPPDDGLREGGGRRASGASGAGRQRAGRCGEDQRRQGGARLRPDRRLRRSGGSGRRRGRGDPGARRPRGGARPGHRDDGVHRRGPRRQGVRRRHPRRRSDRRRGVQPAACARAPRCRSRSTGPSSTRSPPPTSPCTRRWRRSTAASRGLESMPPPQRLPADLIEFGRTIPVARVAAMHEGKRRARARRKS